MLELWVVIQWTRPWNAHKFASRRQITKAIELETSEEYQEKAPSNPMWKSNPEKMGKRRSFSTSGLCYISDPRKKLQWSDVKNKWNPKKRKGEEGSQAKWTKSWLFSLVTFWWPKYRCNFNRSSEQKHSKPTNHTNNDMSWEVVHNFSQFIFSHHIKAHSIQNGAEMECLDYTIVSNVTDGKKKERILHLMLNATSTFARICSFVWVSFRLS